VLQEVRNHLNGGDWKIVVGLTQVESAKRKDRRKLAETPQKVPRGMKNRQR
jgi:hypothetical protein